eukprot:SAG11_NODE_143_length_14870_cov_6.472412_5_plen_153_part_00
MERWATESRFRRGCRAARSVVAAVLLWLTCSLAQKAWPDCEGSGGLLGTANPSVCCLAMCGSCGGAGCNTRPGGASSCCEGAIMSASAECLTELAPPCKFIRKRTEMPRVPCGVQSPAAPLPLLLVLVLVLVIIAAAAGFGAGAGAHLVALV